LGKKKKTLNAFLGEEMEEEVVRTEPLITERSPKVVRKKTVKKKRTVGVHIRAKKERGVHHDEVRNKPI